MEELRWARPLSVDQYPKEASALVLAWVKAVGQELAGEVGGVW